MHLKTEKVAYKSMEDFFYVLRLISIEPKNRGCIDRHFCQLPSISVVVHRTCNNFEKKISKDVLNLCCISKAALNMITT